MITGLYSAIADSIPDPLHHRTGARARLYKEDFQAVDIEAIAKPVTKVGGDRARTGAGAARIQPGVPCHASRRPGPGDRSAAATCNSRKSSSTDGTYEPLAVYKPTATRKQIEKAFDMLDAASVR